MVHIKPLRGWLYNKNIDFSKVVTPPNDVIDEEEKQELKKNPYSFVNLILPDGDGNRYEHALSSYEKWKKGGILVKDKNENIYIYKESYSMSGKEFSRLSFIALMKLEQWGEGIVPHEKVLDKDLKDRIKLISKTKANFGVPFVLYDDRKKKTDAMIKEAIEGRQPYIDFTDLKGVNHTLWKVDDTGFIRNIQDEMKKYQCIMADGHHRYTSELRVKEMLGADYGLMCFANSFNEGMIILPTNRIVFGLDVNMDGFLQKLKKHFDVEEADRYEMINRMAAVEVLIDKKINLKNHVFGIFSNINKKAYFLTLKDNDVMEERMPERTDIYQKLDINILHKLIIEEILGITEEQQKNREHIDFVKGNSETLKKIKDEKIQFAFFVKPPLMREVFLIARAGETTPQKTTCFYPKVCSGLVVYDFDDN